MRRLLALGILMGSAVACGKGGEAPPPAPAPPAAAPAAAPAAPGSALAGLEAEVFVPRCARPGCHAGAPAGGNLDLSAGNAHRNLVDVKAERRPERLRVKAGDPEGSYLVNRLVPGGDTPTMPLGGTALTEAELQRIRSWIADGAKP